MGAPQTAVCLGKRLKPNALPSFLRPLGKPGPEGVFLGPLPYRFALVTSLEYRLGGWGWGGAGGRELSRLCSPPSSFLCEFKEFEVSGDGGVAGSPGVAPGRGVQAQRRVPSCRLALRAVLGPSGRLQSDQAGPGRAAVRPPSPRRRGEGPGSGGCPVPGRPRWPGLSLQMWPAHACLGNFGAVTPVVWGAGGEEAERCLPPERGSSFVKLVKSGFPEPRGDGSGSGEEIRFETAS